MLNWKSTDIVKRTELKPFYWHQGFFHLDFGRNEYYRRDFEELMARDLSMFTLGDMEDKKVLDMGCGSGLYSLTFLKMGAAFVGGQDIDAGSLEITKKTCSEQVFSNFEMKCGNCETLQFEDGFFDIAFSGDVFEHITRQQKLNFILEAYRVLKPGGILTIKTPNKSYLLMTNTLRRLKAAARFRNPFKIHIPHTRGNPDHEHHGLSTYHEFRAIIRETMFHPPVITRLVMNKRGVPHFFAHALRKLPFMNQHIIISVRKPIFFGIYS